MTAQDIINNARALLNAYNYDGVVISSSDTDIKTLETNAILYLNMALREAYRFAEEFGTYNIDATGNSTDDEYTIYDMPIDFVSVDKIINLTPEQTPEYVFVGVDQLYLRNTYLGEMVVSYMKMPTTVTALTDTVEISNPLAIEYVNNFVAARIAVNERPRLVNFFEQSAEEARQRALSKGPASEERIKDFYQVGNYGVGDYCG